MNAAHQAAVGLPAEVFPRDVPVYMGHYHLPQVWRGLVAFACRRRREGVSALGPVRRAPVAVCPPAPLVLAATSHAPDRGRHQHHLHWLALPRCPGLGAGLSGGLGASYAWGLRHQQPHPVASPGQTQVKPRSNKASSKTSPCTPSLVRQSPAPRRARRSGCWCWTASGGWRRRSSWTWGRGGRGGGGSGAVRTSVGPREQWQGVRGCRAHPGHLVIAPLHPPPTQPRHFTFSTPASPSEAEAALPDPALASEAAAMGPGAVAGPDRIRSLLEGGALRRGDRVRVTVAGDAGDGALAALQKAAAGAGARRGRGRAGAGAGSWNCTAALLGWGKPVAHKPPSHPCLPARPPPRRRRGA
jgi:hypothetical protein